MLPNYWSYFCDQKSRPEFWRKFMAYALQVSDWQRSTAIGSHWVIQLSYSPMIVWTRTDSCVRSITAFLRLKTRQKQLENSLKAIYTLKALIRTFTETNLLDCDVCPSLGHLFYKWYWRPHRRYARNVELYNAKLVSFNESSIRQNACESISRESDENIQIFVASFV